MALALFQLVGGGLHRFYISIIRWQDRLVLLNNWTVEVGGVKLEVEEEVKLPPPDPPDPDLGNFQPSQKILNQRWAGVWSSHFQIRVTSSLPKRSETQISLEISAWAHLLSNHSSRLICNADNSWNILTKSSQSLHWKYQISNKNCENEKIIMKGPPSLCLDRNGSRWCKNTHEPGNQSVINRFSGTWN